MDILQPQEIEALKIAFQKDFIQLRDEIAKVIVGYSDIIEQVLISLFAGGHVLLEGVPGLGKTMLVRTMSKVLDISFNRIQFTPDLMPADILGTNLIDVDEHGHRSFQFQAGPIFAHLVLADEVNRATPKTQSALLECMQEKSITSSGITRHLPPPFFVMATQNPLEMEGTYPLPEAQLDRFMFKLLVPFPGLVDLQEILRRTTGNITLDSQKILDCSKILQYMEFAKSISSDVVQEYAARVVLATHPKNPYSVPLVDKYVRYGASPRGAQALILGGKIKAIASGRYNVSFDDIKALAASSLRHRMILNFEGEAEHISTDQIIQEILEKTPLRLDMPNL